jgi:Helix-turn-helix domain
MLPRPQPSYLTPSQLSDRWQVPVRTLYDWQRRRYGPRAVRFGRGERGQLRYRLSDVERFEREQEAAEADIAELAAAAPPLTPGQRARLAALLGVPGPEAAASGDTASSTAGAA